MGSLLATPTPAEIIAESVAESLMVIAESVANAVFYSQLAAQKAALATPKRKRAIARRNMLVAFRMRRPHLMAMHMG